MPMLKKVMKDYYLGDGDPSIFIDEEGLEIGSSWPTKLKKALAGSKCMLAVWSPSYFRRSDWCIFEYSVMRYRQKRLGTETHNNAVSLIWPILFRKLDPIPSFVEETQFLDLSEFNSIISEESNLKKYSELKEKFESKIKSLARIIATAPPWNEEWEKEEWFDEPFKNFNEVLLTYKQTLPSWAM
jgi:hypothetical protein